MLEAPEYKLNPIYDKLSTCRGMAVDEGAPNKTSRQPGMNLYATCSYGERTVFPYHIYTSSAVGTHRFRGSEYFVTKHPFKEEKEFKQFRQCYGGMF